MDFDKIITGIRKALYGREVREYIASAIEWVKSAITDALEKMKELLKQAEAARDAAKASQDAAKVSETNAKASENAAASSASAAAGSASAAKTSENAAKTSETNAKTSETNAKASENETRQLVEAAKKMVNTDKTLTIDGAPADAKTVGDKFKSIKTDWNSVTDKPETFPPSAHNHSKLEFENKNEVNFVGIPENNTVYWGYRDNTIDEYRFNDGRGSGAFANVRANKFIGSLDGNAETSTKTTGITDYNNSSRTIQVGYAGNGLNTSNLTHIAGYTDDGTKIKDVSKDVLKSWLGLDSAASGVQSSGSNYIRFGDGTQICWGTISNVTVTVTGTVEYELYLQTQYETISRNFSAARITFPQAFSNTSYSVVFQNSYNVTDANTYIGSTFDFYSNKYDMNINGGKLVSISSTNPAMGKTTTGCTLNSGGGSMYVAVGRWK